MAWAMMLAVPGVPTRTRISPLRPTDTGMSARMRASRSSEPWPVPFVELAIASGAT